MKGIFIFVSLLTLLVFNIYWGFYAHKEINRLAVYTLPAEISRFYKNNINFLMDHASDPDKRRYVDTSEAPKHYLDVEVYEKNIDNIPRKWEDALQKYGKAKLDKSGILPWQIQQSYYQLVKAFKVRDSSKILIYSVYLGHYLGDAHVPLHTTENHNGQLTNQKGIHAFWESRLPEMFAVSYNFLLGRAVYIQNPLKEAWKIIGESHSLVDSTLKIEAELKHTSRSGQIFSYSKRNGQLKKQYAVRYSDQYHSRLNGMVARQMQKSVFTIGSYWYSAWVDAGQPILNNMSIIR